MIDLSAAERRLLKAHAHKLHPVVMIGDKGLTEAVLHAIDASLKSHELIKVKVASAERLAREAVLASICAATDASPVQHIGKILLLYRENPVLPAAAVPAPLHSRAKPANAKSADNKPVSAKPARAESPRQGAAAKVAEGHGVETARAVRRTRLARPSKRPSAPSGAPRRTR
jgi:RNA-binding protein